MKFEWNADKELANIRKHKIAFSEAKTAFGDEFAILEYDSTHSKEFKMTDKQKEVLRSGKTLPNPFYKKLTTPITIRVSTEVLDYFKSTAKMSKTETLERLINFSLFNAMEKKLPERIIKKSEKAM